MKIRILIFLCFASLFADTYAARQDIPYVKQWLPGNNKGACGAACLAMVYKSFNKEFDQKSIFYKIAIKVKDGSACANFLMARDALRRGFYAINLEIRRPRDFIELFKNGNIDDSVRVIVTQRPTMDAKDWHETVLVEVTDKHVIVHDPLLKPSRRIGKEVFLKMWAGGMVTPNAHNNKIVAVAEKKSRRNNCLICGRHISDFTRCPSCR